MLLYPLGSKSLTITPHSDNQPIPTHLKNLPLLLLLPQISHTPLIRQRNSLQRIINSFLDAQLARVEIHPVRPSLEELRALLVSFARARGFECAPKFERADARGGQERREDEVGAGRDDDDLVFAWV